MRILLVWPYFPPHSGACSVRGAAYKKFLERNNNFVKVITPIRPKFPSPSEKFIVRLKLSEQASLPGIIQNIFLLRREIKKFNPDVIICSIPTALYSFQILLTPNIRRIPFILDVRDLAALIQEFSSPSLKTSIKNLTESFCYKHADEIFVTTAIQKELLVKHYNVQASKIKLVPNGIDLEEFTPVKKGKNTDIVFLGCVNPERDPDRLISAYAELYKLSPMIKFKFVGWDNNEYTKLVFAKMEKEDFFGSVKFIPEISPQEAFKEVCKSRIGVLSLLDNIALQYQLPVKLFDYLAAGIPVVCLGPENNITVQDFINKYKVGYYTSTVHEFVNRLDSLLKSEEASTAFSKNALQVVHIFDRGKIINDAYNNYIKPYAKLSETV